MLAFQNPKEVGTILGFETSKSLFLLICFSALALGLVLHKDKSLIHHPIFVIIFLFASLECFRCDFKLIGKRKSVSLFCSYNLTLQHCHSNFLIQLESCTSVQVIFFLTYGNVKDPVHS